MHRHSSEFDCMRILQIYFCLLVTKRREPFPAVVGYQALIIFHDLLALCHEGKSQLPPLPDQIK